MSAEFAAMDPGEILREYNASVNKDKQVTILAELNACRPLAIALCLREQGAALTATWKARLAAHDKAAKRMELAPAPTEAQKTEPLTAGVLQQLLGRIPGDTPVQILGPSGVATSALFLERMDMQGSSYVLEIQREERP